MSTNVMKHIDESEAIRLASNPRTKPDIIIALSNHNCMDVLKGVATNPATPAWVLKDMLDASWDTHFDTQRAVRAGHIPFHAVHGVLRDETELRKRIVANPNMDAEAMAMIRKDSIPEIRMVAAQSPLISTQALLDLMKHELGRIEQRDDVMFNVGDDRSHGLWWLNKHLVVLEYVIDNLRGRGVETFDLTTLLGFDGSRKQLKRLAKSKNTAADDLVHLFHVPDLTIKAMVAANPTVPDKLLNLWAQDSPECIQVAIKTNPSASEGTLQYLLSNSQRRVKKASSMDQGQLAQVRDQEREFRLRVADHPNAGDRILTYLSRDPDLGVRYRVAMDTRTPATALKGLIAHEMSKKRTNGEAEYEYKGTTINRSMIITMAQSTLKAVIHN